MGEKRPPQGVSQGVVLGVAAAQAGCVIVILVLVALGVGIWLDGQLGTRPLFTLSLVLLGIPLSLMYAIFSILRMARAAQNPPGGTPSAPESRPDKERDP